MRHALGVGLLASLALGTYAYVATTLTACSSDGDGGPDAFDDGYDPPPTPAAWDQPVARPDDVTATQARASCTYKRGDMPAATLGTSTPIDKDIPITNVIVVMMENHSF